MSALCFAIFFFFFFSYMIYRLETDDYKFVIKHMQFK